VPPSAHAPWCDTARLKHSLQLQPDDFQDPLEELRDQLDSLPSRETSMTDEQVRARRPKSCDDTLLATLIFPH
jgi:hypothetical protein